MKHLRLLALSTILFTASSAFATDIEGVQPAALDQPRVNICLRRDPKAEPLKAGKGAEAGINIQAFLDTGASGVMLSATTANSLGVKRESAGGKPIVFHDVGVGGGDTFNVSEPLYLFVAPFGRTGEPDDAGGYPLSVGPVRAQVGTSAGLMDLLTGGLDVVGMPAIAGHVVVLDPRPVDTFGDTMRAALLDPKKDVARIPKTDRHVRLIYASFKRFTHVEPPEATFPALADNPFVGPNPTAAIGAGDAKIPPVVVTFDGKHSSGSWLLDTGAAASMISTKQAEKLGVAYVPGTEGTGSPKLANVPDRQQFTFTVGGVGGQKKSAGFYLDSLALPTNEHDPLTYRKAPVLVCDITVEDPRTKQKITLDGVLGMNYFVASANVEEAGLMPDIKNLTAGPYDAVVFDEPNATLGVKLKEMLKASATKPAAEPKGTIEIKPSRPRRP